MNNKKSLIALALVALVGVVGATFAYFTSSATLNNEFQTGTYSTSVTEEFVSPDNWTPGTTTQKKVNITNKGSVEVAVRASYTETWTSANGTTLNGVRNGERVAQFTIGSDWEKATDGHYYYKTNLGTDETSTDFISSVTFNPNFQLEEGTDIECATTKVNGKTTINCENLTTGYAGATYLLDIVIETIQADQKWEYTVVELPSTTVYKVGDEITIENEVFNVIKDNGDTVTMLAQLGLDSTYRQSGTATAVAFPAEAGWSNVTGPQEIDMQSYDGEVKTYVNNYVTYLQGETGDNTLTGTLITLAELKDLGCTINDDYSYDYSVLMECRGSDNNDWLVNGQEWWTRSIISNEGVPFYVAIDGIIASLNEGWETDFSVRPVVTISKATLATLN